MDSYSPEDNCEGNTLSETHLQQMKLSTISYCYINIKIENESNPELETWSETIHGPDMDNSEAPIIQTLIPNMILMILRF